jgi:hypothetical protein
MMITTTTICNSKKMYQIFFHAGATHCIFCTTIHKQIFGDKSGGRGYRLNSWSSIPSRAIFFPCHNIQFGSGTHQSSYPMGTEVLSFGVK